MQPLKKQLFLWMLSLQWSLLAFGLEPGQWTLTQTPDSELTYQIQLSETVNIPELSKLPSIHLEPFEDPNDFILCNTEGQHIATLNFSASFTLKNLENQILAELTPLTHQPASSKNTTFQMQDQEGNLITIQRIVNTRHPVIYEFKKTVFNKPQVAMRLQKKRLPKGDQWDIVVVEPISIHSLVPLVLAIHEHQIETDQEHLAFAGKIGCAIAGGLVAAGSYYFWNQHKKTQLLLKIQRTERLAQITWELEQYEANALTDQQFFSQSRLQLERVDLQILLQSITHQEALISSLTLLQATLQTAINPVRFTHNTFHSRAQMAQHVEAICQRIETHFQAIIAEQNGLMLQIIAGPILSELRTMRSWAWQRYIEDYSPAWINSMMLILSEVQTFFSSHHLPDPSQNPPHTSTVELELEDGTRLLPL